MTSKSKSSQLLAALPLILFLSSCQSLIGSKSSSENSSAASNQSSTVVSTYLDGKITLKNANEELNKLISKNEKLKGLTFEKLTPQQKETVIKEFVLTEMAYKEAKKRNLNKDKDYQEALRNFESEMLKQKLFLTLAKDAADEKNVRKNYDELAEKLKNKKDLRISYIALKTQSEAEAVYQILSKTPNSFAAQAKKKSIDKEIAKKGGDLGFVLEDSLPAEVVKQTKTLKKGQISNPFTANGKWLVIRFDDERPAEILSFEKAKDALAKNLAKKAMEDFISQSLEKAKINILVK